MLRFYGGMMFVAQGAQIPIFLRRSPADLADLFLPGVDGFLNGFMTLAMKLE